MRVRKSECLSEEWQESADKWWSHQMDDFEDDMEYLDFSEKVDNKPLSVDIDSCIQTWKKKREERKEQRTASAAPAAAKEEEEEEEQMEVARELLNCFQCGLSLLTKVHPHCNLI